MSNIVPLLYLKEEGRRYKPILVTTEEHRVTFRKKEGRRKTHIGGTQIRGHRDIQGHTETQDI